MEVLNPNTSFTVPSETSSLEVTLVPTDFLPHLTERQASIEPFVLFFDIGGTKVMAQLLDSKGRVVESVHETVKLKNGPQGLINQIAEIGLPFVKKYPIDHIDISSAGPLDPTRGLWVNPTNLKTNGEFWGTVDVLTPLRQAFGTDKIALENDAAGQARLMQKFLPTAMQKDFLLLTLGTGVGVAVIKNGKLMRTQEGLHPELSHLPLYELSPSGRLMGLDSGLEKIEETFGYPLACGCGARGCIETFLAGTYYFKGKASSDQQLKLMRSVFLPKVIRRFCQEFGLSKVFVSGSFGQFLLSRPN